MPESLYTEESKHDDDERLDSSPPETPSGGTAQKKQAGQRLPLPCGAELSIMKALVDENGYTVYYSVAGPDHVSFSLGDSQGRPLRKLSDQAVGFDGFDLKAQALVSSGLWMAEYKNKPVPRVSGADIRQAQTLLVETGWRYETRTLPELAVEVPLK